MRVLEHHDSQGPSGETFTQYRVVEFDPQTGVENHYVVSDIAGHMTIFIGRANSWETYGYLDQATMAWEVAINAVEVYEHRDILRT